MRRFIGLIFVAGLCQFGPLVTAPVFGQRGVQSAAMGMARAGLPPTVESVVVEDFVNYHSHDLPLPAKGDMVRLDLRWGDAGGDEAVVQVGLTTPRIVKAKKMPPLNLALVIDHSGSMSGNRIENVKKALLAFVDKLRDTDVVSIVGYNQEAAVLLAPTKRTNVDQIHQVIETISAGLRDSINVSRYLVISGICHLDGESLLLAICGVRELGRVVDIRPTATGLESKERWHLIA